MPADTLNRLAVFTELVATAIANSDARTEIERLAYEQAALMHPPVAAVQRYEDDATTTMGPIRRWVPGSLASSTR